MISVPDAATFPMNSTPASASDGVDQLLGNPVLGECAVRRGGHDAGDLPMAGRRVLAFRGLGQSSICHRRGLDGGHSEQ
jgi:hypothetical protein